MKFILAVTATLCGVASVMGCGEVLKQDFNQHSGAFQTYTKDMAKEDFIGAETSLKFLKKLGSPWGDDNIEVGDGQLRIKNRDGCFGTSKCGGTFDVYLPKMTEATLKYTYMHSEGYEYGKGGKLPGLCDHDCPSGCEEVTDSSGFSARVMWREDDLMSYSYYVDKKEEDCGENWYWGTKTKAGQKNTVEMFVKLNTKGEANGEQRIVLNGKEVYSRNDINWATNPDEHPIELFTFRSFHGGGSESWAPTQDQYIYFDDISVSGCDATGGTPAAETLSAEPEGPPEQPEEPAADPEEPPEQPEEPAAKAEDDPVASDPEESSGSRNALRQELILEEEDLMLNLDADNANDGQATPPPPPPPSGRTRRERGESERTRRERGDSRRLRGGK